MYIVTEKNLNNQDTDISDAEMVVVWIFLLSSFCLAVLIFFPIRIIYWFCNKKRFLIKKYVSMYKQTGIRGHT